MVIYTDDYVKMRMKYDPKGWKKEIDDMWKAVLTAGIIVGISIVITILFAIFS